MCVKHLEHDTFLQLSNVLYLLYLTYEIVLTVSVVPSLRASGVHIPFDYRIALPYHITLPWTDVCVLYVHLYEEVSTLWHYQNAP